MTNRWRCSPGGLVRVGSAALRTGILPILLLFAVEARAQETQMVPVVVDGETVRLEMRIYRPAVPGRVPTLIFNHGSTGRGDDSSLFARPIDSRVLAPFFVKLGWAVVLPARRGRAGSEGHYDEGFDRDRSRGYACDSALSVPGADRALRDIAAATEVILAMPFVDRQRVIMGGQSRGGILSVAYAGQHPAQVKAVINFVGGWLGTGCPTASAVNQTLFRRGARYPHEMLWLYGENDPFYPLAHSRENFQAFLAVGGKAAFHGFALTGANGHSVAAFPEHWASLLDAYLKRRGLP